MRSNSKMRSVTGLVRLFRPRMGFLVLLPILAFSGLSLIVGCVGKPAPMGAYPAPTTVPNRSLVVNFDAPQTPGTTPTPWSNSVSINANLFESNNFPTYTLKTAPANPFPASVTMVNNFKTNVFGPSGVTTTSPIGLVQAPGANSSPLAFHETGTIIDRGDFVYPSLDLQARLEGGNFFDASHFTGVKFMLKVGNADTTTHRQFNIPVYQTQAVDGGGGCTDGPRLCYDHFAADFSAGTGGQWKQFSYLFSDLHQLVAGSIPNPPTLTGINLQQVLWLQWQEGRNNNPGVSSIDLWIDDVELY
ncbi:MAG TPA: hypothetical protein VMV05_00545 [bacterium]|nr:hypothetical protein [bacterium]